MSKSVFKIIMARFRFGSVDPGGKFEAWKARNPNGTFKQFYADKAVSHISGSKVHASLGDKLKPDSRKRARNILDNMIALGLLPSDTLVDYGCGTLRIGVLLIDYLDADRFIGLDIDQRILSAGRGMLPERSLVSKRPVLDVISLETVERAAAMKPKWVLSNGVLQHVHPDELSEYFGNIARFVHAGATAVITAKTALINVQLSAKTWVYSLGNLQEVVAHHKLTIGRVKVNTDDRRGRSLLIMRPPS